MKNKIVFSFCVFLAVFQIYLFFLPSFAGILTYMPLSIGVIMYGFFFVPRDFKYFWAVKILSYLAFTLLLVLGWRVTLYYLVNGSFQITFLVALVIFAVFSIHRVAVYFYEHSIRRKGIICTALLVLFLGAGIANASDYILSLKNPVYFPDLYRNQEGLLGDAVQYIKTNDMEAYLSVTSKDTVKLKLYLKECSRLVSPIKQNFCYKGSYFSFVLAINGDRTSYINQKLQTEDKTGLRLSACDLLPDITNNMGKDFCYRNNATRIEHCDYIKENGQKMICYSDLAYKNRDRSFCDLLLKIDERVKIDPQHPIVQQQLCLGRLGIAAPELQLRP